MRLLLLFSLGLLLAFPGQAQERVRNVRVRAVDSLQLEIQYDLLNTRPGDSVYIEVRSRLRGSLRILPEFVRGDIGTHVTAGSNRRIIWDALANGYSLNEDVQAKIFVKTGQPQVSSRPLPTDTLVAQKSTVMAKPASTERSARQKKSPKPSVFAADSVPTQPTHAVGATPAPQQPASQTAAVVSIPASQSVVKPVVITTTPSPSAPTVVSAPAPQPPISQTAPVVQLTEPNSTIAVVDTVRLRKTRYAGPAWALLSAVAPGIGNIFVQTPKPKIGVRPLLTIGCYGLIAYGLMERKKSQDDYAIYEQQKNATEGQPYYQTANDHNHRYFLATRGAVVVAAADVILTFIRGLRNVRDQKEAKRFDKSVTFRPGLQAGQPTAVIRYSF